jgi:hypothetical protein
MRARARAAWMRVLGLRLRGGKTRGVRLMIVLRFGDRMFRMVWVVSVTNFYTFPSLSSLSGKGYCGIANA